jgi:SAM-dependent methyltransferase
MRLFVAPLALVLACGHAAVPAPPPCPAAHAAEVAVAPPPKVFAPPDEAAVKKWSHDFLDAFDRGDTAAFAAATSPTLIHFEGGTPTSRDKELTLLAKRRADEAHVGKRTWSSEHVYIHENDATFIGEANEHSTGNESHGGNDYVGWYTLTWAQEGGAWMVSFWGWQKGGVGAERDTWNEIYRGGIGFSKEPNRLLKETLRGKKPGAALDVAMGQGRNALYMASQGWKVTGVDFSDEGVRAAREEATKRKLHLDAVNADIDTYDFGAAKWDLVTMIYATSNAKWIEKIKPSLKPGGLFVLEFFRENDPGDGGFPVGQLATLFKDGFEILRDEVVDDVPDWAEDHATLVRFVAKKK